MSETPGHHVNWQGKPCRCHPVTLGHCFGPDLMCQNGSCWATWEEQQENPTPGRGTTPDG